MAPLSAAPVCPLIITSFGFIIKSLEKAEPLPARPLPFWPFGKIAGRVKIFAARKKVARQRAPFFLFWGKGEGNKSARPCKAPKGPAENLRGPSGVVW